MCATAIRHTQPVASHVDFGREKKGIKGEKRGKRCVSVCGCVCGIWERERSIRLVLKYIVKWNHLTEGRAMMINDGVNGERLQPLAFIIEV